MLGLGGTGSGAFVKAWIQHAVGNGELDEDAIVTWTFQPIGSGITVSENAFFEVLRRRFDLPPHRNPGSPESITEIANAVSGHRTLIVLDGFEALLGGGDRAGHTAILHPFRLLLSSLGQRGLCIITTRVAPAELTAEGEPAVVTYRLEGVSTVARVSILRAAGVTGADDELREVVEAYGGHPLALTLLGPYLKTLCAGDIGGAQRLAPLASSPERGRSGEGHRSRRISISSRRSVPTCCRCCKPSPPSMKAGRNTRCASS